MKRSLINIEKRGPSVDPEGTTDLRFALEEY